MSRTVGNHFGITGKWLFIWLMITNSMAMLLFGYDQGVFGMLVSSRVAQILTKGRGHPYTPGLRDKIRHRRQGDTQRCDRRIVRRGLSAWSLDHVSCGRSDRSQEIDPSRDYHHDARCLLAISGRRFWTHDSWTVSHPVRSTSHEVLTTLTELSRVLAMV